LEMEGEEMLCLKAHLFKKRGNSLCEKRGRQISRQDACRWGEKKKLGPKKKIPPNTKPRERQKRGETVESGKGWEFSPGHQEREGTKHVGGFGKKKSTNFFSEEKW